jgi:glycosyltransferase involved in cell wall biosynthesis
MPVYNGGPYLREAIDSILAQTYPDFELLIIDDGSTDDSAQVIGSYRDRRIRQDANPANLGTVPTLNRGLDLARGEYVAVMHADDVSHPERLARQVCYLDRHPRVGVVGTWATTFGDGPERPWRLPTRPESVVCASVFNCALIHPSVMLRRAWLDGHDLRYDPSHLHAEDYGLLLRASRHFLLANLPEILLRYRVHPSSTTQRHRARMMQSVHLIHADYFRLCGLPSSDAERAVHHELAGLAPDGRVSSLAAAHAWLVKLSAFNRSHRVWPEPHFGRRLGNRWLWACLASPGPTGRRADAFFRSPLARPALTGELQRFCDHPRAELRAALAAVGLASGAYGAGCPPCQSARVSR